VVLWAMIALMAERWLRPLPPPRTINQTLT